jgi:molybdopterin molybdotransferase
MVKARITHEIERHQDFRLFLRGKLWRDDQEGLVCKVQGNQSSALLRSAHEANCLIVLSEDASPVMAGTSVDCMRLDIEEGTEL